LERRSASTQDSAAPVTRDKLLRGSRLDFDL
jgi:hypothetical protein